MFEEEREAYDGGQKKPIFPSTLFQDKTQAEPLKDQRRMWFMDKEASREDETKTITSGYLRNNSSSPTLSQRCPGTKRCHSFCLGLLRRSNMKQVGIGKVFYII